MAIYLNSNIITNTSNSVQEAMEPFLYKGIDFNITSKENQKALKAYKDAIDKIYRSVNAKDEDTIILNSSANESTSAIFLSIYLKYILTGRKNSIIISHRASEDELKVAKFLESQGCRVHTIPITADGTIDVSLLKEYLTNKTALVSLALVDEESGVIQPIEEICQTCALLEVPLYINAKDAIGRIPLDIQRDKVSFLSFCSDNIEGPKDIAALYIASDAIEIMPTVFGSDTEQAGLRASIKDVAKVIGFGKALEEATDALDFEIEDIRELRDELEEALLKIDGSYSLAPWAIRVPTVSIFAFEGIHASMLLDKLAKKDISAYSFAIFNNKNFERVSLIDIASLDSSLKHSIIGFSLSVNTTSEDIEETIKAVTQAVEEIREYGDICKEIK